MYKHGGIAMHKKISFSATNPENVHAKSRQAIFFKLHEKMSMLTHDVKNDVSISKLFDPDFKLNSELESMPFFKDYCAHYKSFKDNLFLSVNTLREIRESQNYTFHAFESARMSYVGASESFNQLCTVLEYSPTKSELVFELLDMAKDSKKYLNANLNSFDMVSLLVINRGIVT